MRIRGFLLSLYAAMLIDSSASVRLHQSLDSVARLLDKKQESHVNGLACLHVYSCMAADLVWQFCVCFGSRVQQ